MNRIDDQGNEKGGATREDRHTRSVIIQQRIYSPVYIRRVPDEMDDAVPNRDDDNLVFTQKWVSPVVTRRKQRSNENKKEPFGASTDAPNDLIINRWR